MFYSGMTLETAIQECEIISYANRRTWHSGYYIVLQFLKELQQLREENKRLKEAAEQK